MTRQTRVIDVVVAVYSLSPLALRFDDDIDAPVDRPAICGLIGCQRSHGTVAYRHDAIIGQGSIRHQILPHGFGALLR